MRCLRTGRVKRTPAELAALGVTASESGVWNWDSHVLDATFASSEAAEQKGALGGLLQSHLDRLCLEAAAAIEQDNVQVLILSDRASGPERVPIPSLLALGAVHHHLIKGNLRMKVALVVENGEAK